MSTVTYLFCRNCGSTAYTHSRPLQLIS